MKKVCVCVCVCVCHLKSTMNKYMIDRFWWSLQRFAKRQHVQPVRAALCCAGAHVIYSVCRCHTGYWRVDVIFKCWHFASAAPYWLRNAGATAVCAM